MKQIAWVKVIQNKYIKRCMSIVGIVIVLLGAMLLYHITGLRKNEYTKKEPLLLNWTVVSENQTDTDVDLNTFRFDNILTEKKTVYLSRTFVIKGSFNHRYLWFRRIMQRYVSLWTENVFTVTGWSGMTAGKWLEAACTALLCLKMENSMN